MVDELKKEMLEGFGPEEAAERHFASGFWYELQDQILLMGSRDDAADFMRRAAILVQPSLYEGLPLALQEGMYYGCAAVATRVIGNEELILDGTTGLLVPPDNPGALALALDGLMKDPARRERFGRASAAAIVEKGMTASKMVEQHLALYNTVGLRTGVGS
jgi:glycosyltransferase involved in cell wall biosynthesis